MRIGEHFFSRRFVVAFVPFDRIPITTMGPHETAFRIDNSLCDNGHLAIRRPSASGLRYRSGPLSRDGCRPTFALMVRRPVGLKADAGWR